MGLSWILGWVVASGSSSRAGPPTNPASDQSLPRTTRGFGAATIGRRTRAARAAVDPHLDARAQRHAPMLARLAPAQLALDPRTGTIVARVRTRGRGAGTQ